MSRLGTEEVLLLKELRLFAEANPISLEDVTLTVSGEKAPVGDDPRFVRKVGDFRVVFSQEHQPRGLARHISISIHERSLLEAIFPATHKRTMNEIIELFGFDETRPWLSWYEVPTPGMRALNVLQPLLAEGGP